MVDLRRLIKEYCPVVEEFNVRNILGAYEQKEWMFSYRHTMAGQDDDITLSTITGGILTKLDHYRVLAQKLDSFIMNRTYVTAKSTSQFTLHGDNAGLYSIIILGSEIPATGDSPNIVPTAQKGLTGRWAKDYCPYCKAYNIKTLVGGILKDVVAFSFKWTNVGAASVVDFRTATKVNDANDQTGLGKAYLVSQMYGTDYGIAITKSSTGAVATDVYASALTKAGFTLNGENAEDYDVLIVGQIQY